MLPRRRKEARPAEILAAALAVFLEKGFAAARLDEIVARAGASKGTAYRYFVSKEALFEEAIRSAILPSMDALEAVVADPDENAASQLRRLVSTWWELLSLKSVGPASLLVLSEERNFPEIARFFRETGVARSRAVLRRVVERGLARGEFAVRDVDIAVEMALAPILSMAVTRYSISLRSQSLMNSPADVDAMMNVLLNGLTAR